MSPNRTDSRSKTWLLSLRVVAVYVVISLLWITASDEVVSQIANDEKTLTRLQTIKGWAFILLTGFLLYGLIIQALRQQARSAEGLAERTAQLDLLLGQMPAIVWTTDRDLKMTSSMGGGLVAAGVTPNRSVGLSLSALIQDLPDKDQILAAAEAVLHGQGAHYSAERQGRIYDTTMVPLTSESGEIQGVLGLAIDVTEARQMEAQQIDSLERLRRSNEQRDRLVRHLVHAEKAERDRIAAGIHDDTIQVMTSAGMALDLLISKLDDEYAVNLSRRSRQYIATAIKRLRTLVFELRPIELETNRVAVALRYLLEQSAEEAGFSYEVRDNLEVELTQANRYLLYRIAQEAITNARKHSRADQVSVTLDQVDDGVRMVIQDDGAGFDPDRNIARDHFGLRDMRERTELVGGRFEIAVPEMGGTRVDVWIPISPQGLRSEAS